MMRGCREFQSLNDVNCVYEVTLGIVVWVRYRQARGETVKRDKCEASQRIGGPKSRCTYALS